MPYIDAETKSRLDSGETPRTAEEMHYLTYQSIESFVVHNGLTYDVLTEAIRGVADALAEFRVRISSSYENMKRKSDEETELSGILETLKKT